MSSNLPQSKFLSMSMKHQHHILLIPIMAGVIAATGCSDDNTTQPTVNDPSVIAFNAPAVSVEAITQKGAVKSASRSTLLHAFPQGESFNVLGYCIPRKVGITAEADRSQASERWANKADFSVADVFYNTPVSVSGATATYSGTLKQWYTTTDNNDAANFRYSFMAYYPTGCFTVSPADANTVGAPVFTFTVPTEAYSDHTLMPDAMIAANFNHRQADGKVDLTFRHLLTAFRFRINNYDTEQLKIESVALSGQFYRSSTFSFATEAVSQTTPQLQSNSYQGNFQIISATDNFQVAGGGSKMLGTAADGTDGTSLLLLTNPAATPEAVDTGTDYFIGNNKILAITYSIGADTPVTVNVPFQLTYKTAPAHRYTVNLNFVGDKFVLTFLADNNENWEDGSDNDITIN